MNPKKSKKLQETHIPLPAYVFIHNILKKCKISNNTTLYNDINDTLTWQINIEIGLIRCLLNDNGAKKTKEYSMLDIPINGLKKEIKKIASKEHTTQKQLDSDHSIVVWEVYKELVLLHSRIRDTVSSKEKAIKITNSDSIEKCLCEIQKITKSELTCICSERQFQRYISGNTANPKSRETIDFVLQFYVTSYKSKNFLKLIDNIDSGSWKELLLPANNALSLKFKNDCEEIVTREIVKAIDDIKTAAKKGEQPVTLAEMIYDIFALISEKDMYYALQMQCSSEETSPIADENIDTENTTFNNDDLIISKAYAMDQIMLFFRFVSYIPQEPEFMEIVEDLSDILLPVLEDIDTQTSTEVCWFLANGKCLRHLLKELHNRTDVNDFWEGGYSA